MITDAELATNNPKELAQRIQQEFPNLKINSYKFIDHGWDHEVLLINQNLIFRFPNSVEYLKKFKNEVGFLQFVALKVAAQIPQYKFVAKDFSFGGYGLIPGKELLRNTFKDLKANEDKIARQLGAFLSTLHNLRASELERFKLSKADLEKEQIKLKAQLHKYLTSVLNSIELQMAQTVLEAADKALATDTATTFTHHDISEGHLLWDSEKGRLGVIDFSDMCLGDPAFDFAELFGYGSDFVRKVYAHYSGPKDDSFLERALAYQHRVGVFLLANSFVKKDKIAFDDAKRYFDEIIHISL